MELVRQVLLSAFGRSPQRRSLWGPETRIGEGVLPRAWCYTPCPYGTRSLQGTPPYRGVPRPISRDRLSSHAVVRLCTAPPSHLLAGGGERTAERDSRRDCVVPESAEIPHGVRLGLRPRCGRLRLKRPGRVPLLPGLTAGDSQERHSGYRFLRIASQVRFPSCCVAAV